MADGLVAHGDGSTSRSATHLNASVKELRERGVTVTDPVEEAWGTHTKATDPDGHEVQISQKD
jgi:lactoylglutathione lyase